MGWIVGQTGKEKEGGGFTEGYVRDYKKLTHSLISFFMSGRID